jgi:hypothetical protein
MATAAETVQEEIVAKEAKIRDLDERLQDAPTDQHLKERLVALEQQLAALRQKEVLLMQQQAGAAG